MMFIPPSPHNPDDHLRQAREKRDKLDAESRREGSLRSLKSLSTGDVLVIGGTALLAVLAITLFFWFF